jgi:ankyrin repeat protein
MIGSLSGSDIHYTYNDLLMAVTDGTYDDVNKIVASDPALIRTPPSEHGVSLLHHAAEKSHDPRVYQMLLDHGLDANASTDLFKQTPLLFSCLGNNLTAAQFLVEHGARINDRDDEGDTPLLIALQEGSPALIDFLLSHNASLDGIGSRGCWFDGILADFDMPGYQRRNALSVILRHQVGIDIRNAKGNTIYHQALLDGNDDAVAVLIDNRINPFMTDARGVTVYALAVKLKGREFAERVFAGGPPYTPALPAANLDCPA